jgi:hypothetical protein
MRAGVDVVAVAAACIEVGAPFPNNSEIAAFMNSGSISTASEAANAAADAGRMDIRHDKPWGRIVTLPGGRSTVSMHSLSPGDYRAAQKRLAARYMPSDAALCPETTASRHKARKDNVQFMDRFVEVFGDRMSDEQLTAYLESANGA